MSNDRFEAQAAVRDYHLSFQLVINDRPTMDVPDAVKELRCLLIEEEAAEFRAAVNSQDLVAVADAVGDLLYVVYGAATTFGIPVEEVLAEVHRSNMTKLGSDCRPIFRADGKVVKGPDFSPPDLAPILDSVQRQGP